MKKLTILFILVILSGCSAGASIGPPENPYGDAHIEITKKTIESQIEVQ